MIPIAKNIIVVDEQGNYYEATYPKRAAGLVKNGRARFIDENTICLACPPYDMEDKHMSNNTENQIFENQKPEKLTMNYVLEQLEKIVSQTDHLTEAFEGLNNIDTRRTSDIGIAQSAEAFATIVKCRETTNQKLITLYEKMYDDLKPKNTTINLDFFKERFCDPSTPIEEKGMLMGLFENYL
uniref:hypothetical protein n=1 Tax=Acetatifactor sp. TaxID=1872090 RepID=UPI0040560E23